MKKNQTFAVIGGDQRSAHLANILAQKNPEARVYGLYLDSTVKLSGKVNVNSDIRLVLPQSDIIIFPLPAIGSDGYVNTSIGGTRVLLEECMDYIQPGSLILAGKFPSHISPLAMERGIELIDYLDREEFAVLNAVPTAEGAVAIALKETPVTLYRSTCIIMGYGRIGKVLTRLLLSFGADVRVAARKYSDLAWIGIGGAVPVHISDIDRHLKDADILFNTIPALVLGEEKLEKLGRHSLVIDLASNPGGVDFGAAEQLGIRAIQALSLPGKSAPVSAGEIILSTIRNILEERGLSIKI